MISRNAKMLAAGSLMALCPLHMAQAQDHTTDATQDNYTFKYVYPDAAHAIAPLRVWLEQDRKKLRQSTVQGAASARQEADGTDVPQVHTQKTWKVVTDTPRFLSLSGELNDYSGGAHGDQSSTAIVWDKSARRTVDPKTMFVSLERAEQLLKRHYCTQFAAQRLKRLKENHIEPDERSFCPALSELTVLPGSSDKAHINRLGLIADASVAGDAPEGPYEITLPVTPQLLQVIKSAYRTGFAPAR